MTRLPLLIGSLVFGLDAWSATTCEKGLQPFEERCISQEMADYISCVQASGANMQYVKEEIMKASKQAGSGEGKGEGSGVVVRGSGSLKLGASTERDLVGKLEKYYFPRGMGE